ncbi:MAG: CDP-archaeol synthase [Chloroflexi bacterium]|nr:CDP-archaeol synthase [Chloroflexota bacterium]
MLRQRIIVTLLLLPPGITCIFLGGVWYFAFLLTFFLLAAYEYAQMMQKGGYRPAAPIIVGGVFVLALAHSAPTFWPQLESRAGLIAGGALVALLAAASLWHTIDYELGAPASATDWAITIAGFVYLGWMGGYIMLLRALPDGLSWTMMVFPAIWLSDSGAYVVGKRFGKTQMTRRLSPKKTWEGFVGGLVWGAVFGALFGWFGSFRAGPESSAGFVSGGAVGLVVSVAGVLGDLGISMLKRQIGIKDTSNLLGPHGGLLDRIDSWIIAAPIAYFVIITFFQ